MPLIEYFSTFLNLNLTFNFLAIAPAVFTLHFLENLISLSTIIDELSITPHYSYTIICIN